jgi:hypothetical protein
LVPAVSAQVAGGGMHILVRRGAKLSVVDASSSADAKLDDKKEVALGNLKFQVDRRAEWAQIYHAA